MVVRLRVSNEMGPYESYSAENIGIIESPPFFGGAVCNSFHGRKRAMIDDYTVNSSERFETEVYCFGAILNIC
jgi:hypothetical protein